MSNSDEDLKPHGQASLADDAWASPAISGLGHLRIHINCDKKEIDINKLRKIIDDISAKHLPIISVELLNSLEGQLEDLEALSKEAASRHQNNKDNRPPGEIHIHLNRSERQMLVDHLKDLAREGCREVTSAEISGSLQDPARTPPDLIIFIGSGRKLGRANLWSGAYSEFFFFDGDFQAFEAKDLTAAIAGFGKRERRFGGIS